MTWLELLKITPYPGLSLLLLFLVISLVFYFSRRPMRAALLHAGNALYRACRLGSVALSRAEQAVRLRNREVLLEQGRQEVERAVAREFERVGHAVSRELGDYPALHRQVNEVITAIEEDYQSSREVPPAPHAWAEAVEAISRIPRADTIVVTMLESMLLCIESMEERAIKEYRHQSRERHRLLGRARPQWQALVRRLGGTEDKLQRLLDRADSIDRHMASYAAITQGGGAALGRLSASSLTRFLYSSLALAVAVGAVVVNFHLIERPMAVMVGGSTAIGGVQVAGMAGLILVLLQVFAGLFLVESLRISRMFPAISALDDRLRLRVMWAALGIVLALALAEAGLAMLGGAMAQHELATSSTLFTPPLPWLATSAQMIMGFALPLALTFAAIVLEPFIQSLRAVLGMLAVALLRASAALLRIAGAVGKSLGPFLAEVCDALAFLPLWLEGRYRDMDADTIGLPRRHLPRRQ